MKSNKLILFSLVTICLFGNILLDSLNTCSNLGKMPSIASDCTSFNNSTDTCCFISAWDSTNNQTISACFALPPEMKETELADAAAKALGSNSNFSCGSFFYAVSSMIVFIYAFVF
jgi:hypothetical protein